MSIALQTWRVSHTEHVQKRLTGFEARSRVINSGRHIALWRHHHPQRRSHKLARAHLYRPFMQLADKGDFHDVRGCLRSVHSRVRFRDQVAGNLLLDSAFGGPLFLSPLSLPSPNASCRWYVSERMRRKANTARIAILTVFISKRLLKTRWIINANYWITYIDIY